MVQPTQKNIKNNEKQKRGWKKCCWPNRRPNAQSTYVKGWLHSSPLDVSSGPYLINKMGSHGKSCRRSPFPLFQRECAMWREVSQTKILKTNARDGLDQICAYSRITTTVIPILAIIWSIFYGIKQMNNENSYTQSHKHHRKLRIKK